MNKNELLSFCRENPRCHIATIDNGAPRVRALRIYKVEEDGLLIQTFKSKDLYQQMSSNPEVELCFNNYEAGVQVRIRGIVKPVEDTAAIKQAIEDRPFLKEFIDKGQEIALLRLDGGVAHIWTKKVDFEPKVFIEL